MRRKGRLVAVLGTILFNTGLEVIKPWPMVFLIDYVLQDKQRPTALSRFLDWLPGAHTMGNFVAWSVAATILIFLLGWAVELANAYLNISWAQRMVYDLAGDLFVRLQELSLRFHTSRSVGDSIRRVTADCSCVSTIVKDALLPVLSALFTLVSMFAIMWRLDQNYELLKHESPWVKRWR